MKNHFSILSIFLFVQFGLFGQKELNNKNEIIPTQEEFESISQESVSESNQGEQSLIRYLNKLSDEELLEILKKQLIVGEIVYRKKD